MYEILYKFIADKKSMLFGIGLLALAFLVMPNASAKFAGEHMFISGANVDCKMCHRAEADEITAGTAHVNMECQECHIPSKDKEGAKFHAAALVECLYCHGKYPGNKTSLGSVIPDVNVSEEFIRGLEAHAPVYNVSQEYEFLKGVNEGCIACHTHGAIANIVLPEKYLYILANYTKCEGGENCYNGWIIIIREVGGA